MAFIQHLRFRGALEKSIFVIDTPHSTGNSGRDKTILNPHDYLLRQWH